jgi:chromate transporter
MPDSVSLLALAKDFGLLSLQAVGGGSAVLPEMQRLVEGTYHIKPEDFAEIYSLGQLAPGPNMLMVVVLGDRIAGLPGAIVVLLAFFVPASVLCYGAGRLWEHFRGSPWRQSVQDGMAPISIGLMAAGVYSIGRFATTTLLTAGIAVVMIALILRTKINPTLIILACAVFGAFFLPRS